jgi:hypothetical protein
LVKYRGGVTISPVMAGTSPAMTKSKNKNTGENILSGVSICTRLLTGVRLDWRRRRTLKLS